ncbi:MAG: UbiA family prenyltransferase [bacterium]|nr:UbiA family prenyltransferase [bacterium]
MNFLRIIKISRPRFWIYELGTFFIGYIISINQLNDFLNYNFLIYLFYFLFPANLLIYGINDIFDYETDKLNPKKQQYEELLLPEYHKFVYFWIIITNIPFVIYSFLSLNFYQNILFLLFLFFAYFYSAKPIRAKSIPILDSFFSASHYVFTGIFGFSLINNYDFIYFPFLGFIFGIFWAIAMHAYSAILDIDYDKSSNIQTIAVLLGVKRTIYLCLVLYGLSFLILYNFNKILILGFIPYAILMVISLKNYNNYSNLMKIYKYFPYLNTILPMIWSILYIYFKFN